MFGRAEAISSLNIVARCDARGLNKSRRAGSVESRPLKVLAITGNTDAINADTATDFRPKSNQITSSGAIATIGTVWKKTVYG